MTKQIHKVPVDLTHKQFKALTSGGAIRLKHSQIANGGEDVLHFTSKVQARKIAKAVAQGKGVQIQLSPNDFRQTMEGEGFGRWLKKAAKKTGKWLEGAANEGWKAVKAVGRLAYKAADRGIDAAADSAPIFAKAVAPAVGKAALMYVGGAVNPANAVKDHIDVGLFGIHNRTPDHVLKNNNSNFIAAAAPASNPTLLQQDPLARMLLGTTISGPDRRKKGRKLQALDPPYRQYENIRNTPAALVGKPVVKVGGSFTAAGYGFKPAGDY